jgi:hypothetical protein
MHEEDLDVNRKRSRLWPLALALFFALAGPVFATPTPPLVVVNHDTKECAEIFGGDECKLCYAPIGWEELGYQGRAQCPKEYAIVKIKERNCIPVQSEFCCILGSSGTGGDCESLIINDRTEQCAFVDDLATCILPGKWRARPAETESDRWRCPWTYQWVRNVDCSGEPESDTLYLAAVGLCVAVAIVAASAALVWLLIKQRNR